jgi:hypothetical protein
MSDSDVMDEFKRLLAAYDACVDAAHRMVSPNAEDDVFTKMAIVGFSYHQKTEEWQREHWVEAKEFLKAFDQPEDSATAKGFAMLAVGALLGLRSSGRLDERGLSVGCAVLPGFIAAKAL